MFSELQDKVVLITGASGHVGKAIAVEFARHGSRLVLTGRDEDRLRHTAALCKDAGIKDNKLLLVTADLTNENDNKRLVQETVKKYGTVHILVNSAAVMMLASSGSVKAEDLDRVFDLNCRSVFILIQKLVPYLVENKGCIVNISNTQRPNPGFIAYAMSKACLDQMTKALALELGPKGVRVNGINPATLEDGTFFSNCSGGLSKEQSQEHFTFLRSSIPLGRLGNVQDVVKAVLFLTSDKAAFVSGLLLPVDGGFRNQKLFFPKQFTADLHSK